MQKNNSQIYMWQNELQTSFYCKDKNKWEEIMLYMELFFLEKLPPNNNAKDCKFKENDDG